MTEQSRTFAVLVDNEPGVLARVIGLFSGRGYNIDSLTVSEVNAAENWSRITIVTSGTAQILEQIHQQLLRIVPVLEVADMGGPEQSVERELALVKVRAKDNERVESLRLADVFGATVVDASLEHFTFQLTGRSAQVDRFIALMEPLGLCDLSRTGVVGIMRGPEGMTGTK